MPRRAGWAPVLLVVLALPLLLAFGASAQTTSTTSSLLVKLVPGLTAEQEANVIARNGGVVLSSIPALRLYVVAVPVSDVATVTVAYQIDPQVQHVEPNKIRVSESIPSDPLYGNQWYLPRIAWDRVFGSVTPGGSAKVALLDTGVDASHPELAGKVVPGTSILDGSSGMTDPSGHGTWLAGIIGARTDVAPVEGVAAVAYAGVQIMPVTVLDPNGEGMDSDVIAGVIWAADHGADVILMAFSNPGFSPSLQDAIDYAWSKGAVLVAAVGNNASSAPTFPAGDRGVMGVAATDPADSLAYFSNTGQAVFIAAPGTDIQAIDIGDAYTVVNGTSTSAAIVAGAAALMKAVDPSLTNGVIVGRLARNADPAGAQTETGNGRINLARALADTSTEPIQPAGADPVGAGGPFVGPYQAAARNIRITFAGTGSGQVTIGTLPGQVSFNTSGANRCDTPPASGTGNNTATVTINGTCTTLSSSDNGATVTVTALPNTGTSFFAGWSAPNGSFTSCTLTSPTCSTTLGGGQNDLTVTFTTRINTTTAASNATATFGDASVTLNAMVTPASGSAVGEGTVTFTVKKGATVFGSVTSGTVSAGNASAAFSLAGVNADTYSVEATYNPAPTNPRFNGSTGSATLTVNKAASTTTAANKTATFSTTGQPVTLTATVTYAAGAVNQGSVTFTVKDGTTQVGSSASGSVSGGNASATFTLPGGSAAKTYTIEAAYTSDPSGNFTDSSDNNKTLTVTKAGTTTTATNATATFNSAAQPVPLSATVTSLAGTVNQGSVTFTVKDGSTPIGSSVSGSVTSGSASATFTLPAGTAAKAYTIEAAYTSGPTGNFTDSSDNNKTLTVTKAGTTTTTANATATFNSAAQLVPLSATVTSLAGTVNQGSVTFTVKDGSTPIGSSVSGSVTSGSASATFTLPAGTAAKAYTIEAAYTSGPTGNFTDSSDNNKTLTVTKAGTTTTTADATATFSSAAQPVPLSAAVTSTAGTVNQGAVTFTVKDGSTPVGSPVSGSVTSGSATATFTLPGGTAAKTYTIEAAYTSGPMGNFADSFDTKTLTVLKAPTTTAAVNATATFNSAAQLVPLSATVTSMAGTVNQGSVTFTVKDGSTPIGSSVSESVTSGSATASFTLPAGTPAKTYTIEAAYSSGPTGNFADSFDNTKTLTVTKAATTTTAANATATFSSADQPVSLSAGVISAAGTVNQGSVTFTVKDGSVPVGGPVSGSVTSGSATATFTLPGGTAAKTYTIEAAYTSGPTGNFADSFDNKTLTVTQAATTTAAENATAIFNSADQLVPLSATVISAAGTVNQGSVTFTVKDGTTPVGPPVSGSVTSGSATATFTLPGGTAAKAYTIEAAYTNGPTGNFADSSDNTRTLTVTKATTTTTAENATATFNSADQPVPLSATVISAAGTVNQGSVTFTVKDGSTPIGSSVSGSVTSGSATATFTLPGGTAAKAYTIEAAYTSGPTGNFADSSDDTRALTISAATTNTTIVAPMFTNNTTLSITVNVASAAGTPNGTVDLTLDSGPSSPVLTLAIQPLIGGSASFIVPGLTDGTYLLSATYTPGDGNFLTSNGAWTTVIDTAAPDTVIESGPAGMTTATTATFTYHGSDTSGDTFQCSLDGGPWTDCNGPASPPAPGLYAVTYTDLLPGPHNFQVRGTDMAGNADGSPASRSWIIGSVTNDLDNVDEVFKHFDGFDVVFGKGTGTSLRLTSTNPGTFHHQLFITNNTGVSLNTPNGETAYTSAIIEVPGLPASCGLIPCSSQVGPVRDPVFKIRGHSAAHVWPDNHEEQLAITVQYMTLAGYQSNGNSCADVPGAPYTSTLPADGAPKCIKVSGFALPHRHRARIRTNFEFRLRGTDLWDPNAKLYFFAGFAFKSATTVTYGGASQTSIDTAAIVGAGNKMTAVGGFVFNPYGAPGVGMSVRLFNSPALVTACASTTNVVARDVVDATGFYFLWRTGLDNDSAQQPTLLPSGIQYAVQLCNGGTQVGPIKTTDEKLHNQEFEQVDFDGVTF